MADALPTSLGILTNAVSAFAERCVRGIEADRARLRAGRSSATPRSPPALAPTVGYEVAARIAQRAVAEDLTIKDAALAEGVLDAETLDRLLDLHGLVRPGLPGGGA